MTGITPTPAPPAATAADRLIPGAFEQRPRTDRAPGAMGDGMFGAGGAATGPSTMLPATIADREREGGGGPGERGRGAGPAR